jgi:DNA-binding MarR family transcriptional regulator
MIGRFKEFTKNISFAYKYIIKLKSAAIREFGLKGSHVMCLFYIGEADNGLTATKLCKLCGEDKAAISKSLSALLELGYVELENDENKKYRSKYFLTKSGKRVKDALDVKISDVVADGGIGLTEEEREAFYSALQKIVDNLENISRKFSEDE